MKLRTGQKYSRGDDEFEEALDLLEKKYFHNGGSPESETILNWSKQEAKEEGVISLYGSTSVISSAIKRCRKGIRSVEILGMGVNMLFDKKFVRPIHTVLKVAK